MKILWYWSAIFKDPSSRHWQVKSDTGFPTKENASNDLQLRMKDGSIVNAGVPCGSVVVEAEAVLENKKET